MFRKSTNIKGLFLLIAILSLSSCSVSKYLDDNQYLVKKNKVVIEDKANSKDDGELIYNLESLVIQKPNTNYALTPRELIYFRNKEEYESTEKREGRLKEAQRPVIHNDILMQKTAERMEKYLRNSKGFYFAKVIPSATLSQKRAIVTYTVFTDVRYTVRSKEYFVDDPKLMEMVERYEEGSLIKPGTKIDESIFEAEKSRLFTKLQNKGYAAFAKNFIEFQADSSNMQMDVFVRISPPPNQKYHQKYKIGKITVYPNYLGTKEDNTPFREIYDGVTYEFTTNDPFVKASAIGRVIQLQEGQQYKKRYVDNTYASLSKLGTYRFINIASQVNPLDSSIIDYSIFLTPIEKKLAFDSSINLFYTFINQQGGNINRLGVSANTSFTNSNTFGGAEKLSFSAEATGEITLARQPDENLNFSLQSGLTLPRLVDFRGSIDKLLNVDLVHFKKRSEDAKIDIKNKTVTTYFASYSFIQQFNDYTIHSLNASASYEFKPNSKFNYFITPLNVNSLSTNVDSVFQAQILDSFPLLARSFDKRLITTFAIPNLLYQMSSPVFDNGFNWNIQVNSEISGLEILGLNGLYNLVSGNTDTWAIQLAPNNIFEFSRFALIDADANATQIIYDKHKIAGRIRAGIALPLLQNDVIPFVRQFYVGGGNSIRAWQVRELGPGGYNQPPSNNGTFNQSGDIVLEGGIEYRFPITGIFEGGVFLDAGNVWIINEDPDRPGAQFKFDEFYKQIAVGTGFGLRMDLSLFIARIDFGYRLRNNFWDNGYSALPKSDFSSIYSYAVSPNISFALAYPF